MNNPESVDFDSFLEGDIEEWIESLPPYQKSTIENMLVSQEPTEVAISWLTSSGPSDTAPFGGIRTGATLFYENLLREIQDLVCGGSKYDQERKNVMTAVSAGKMFIVSSVSIAVAPYVGAAAIVIGPAVAIVLAILSNSGMATACEGIKMMISKREALKKPES